MTNQPPKLKKPTKAQLQRKVLELESQLIHVYHFAAKNLDRVGTDRLLGSGVILQLSLLGGAKPFAPVMIRNGLSRETINALKADLIRSYEDATVLKP